MVMIRRDPLTHFLEQAKKNRKRVSSRAFEDALREADRKLVLAFKASQRGADAVDCPLCEGNGRMIKATCLCPRCGGRGFVYTKHPELESDVKLTAEKAQKMRETVSAHFDRPEAVDEIDLAFAEIQAEIARQKGRKTISFEELCRQAEDAATPAEDAPMENPALSFEEALVYLKSGRRIARGNWSKAVSGVQIIRGHLVVISSNTVPNYYGFIGNAWFPLGEDLLADDWFLAD